MSGLLQRLVARARNDSDPSLLRIEPLLTARYARAPGNVENSVQHEVHLETADLGDPVVAAVDPKHTIATSHANVTASSPHRDDKSSDASMAYREAGADILPTPRTIEQASGRSLGPVGMTIRSTPSPAPVNARHHFDTSSTKQIGDVSPAPPLRMRPDRVSVHTPKSTIPGQMPVHTKKMDVDASSQSAPAARHDGTTLVDSDSTPTITISIGHVEVRSAPTPAPTAQRRSTFRPKVSLEAFLRRGGSDGQ